jgi:hypothetical protein
MPTDSPVNRSAARGRGGRLDAVIVCLVVAICAAIVLGLAWSRPTTTTATLAYTQSGHLSYTAPTRPTSVYGGAGVTTGQPVYGAAVKALSVTYTYQFQSAATATLGGTEQLVASINNGEGLSRTIPLQPQATPFAGSRFTVTGTLETADLQSVAVAFDQAEGSAAPSAYTVEISPSVSLHGRLGRAPLTASFNPAVSFSYTGQDLVPGTSGVSSTGGGPASFAASASGSVSVADGQPATLWLGVSVTSARLVALLLLVAALLLGGVAGWPLLRQATSEDEPARIAARYGSSIVEADAVAVHAGVVAVELFSFEGVLQVAHRLECPILHWEDQGDVYAVVDSSTLYRYRTAPSRSVQLVREQAARRRAAAGEMAVVHGEGGDHVQPA